MVDILWEFTDVQLGSVIAAGGFSRMHSPHGLTDLLQDFRIAALQGVLTLLANDLATASVLVPMLFQAELTDAEVLECITLNTVRESHANEREANMRRVFPLTDAQGNPIHMQVSGAGEAVVSAAYRMKLNQTFREDVGWNIGFFNAGLADTTAAPRGSNMGKIFGVWI